MGKIICTGNRFAAGDDFGPRVFEHLSRTPLPDGVELVDGGLAGLDLLPLVEGDGPVVFVDALDGGAEPGQVAVLNALEAAAQVEPGYGHADGLAYLLRVLPAVVAAPLPPIHLVGAAGRVSDGTVAEAAETALRLAQAPSGDQRQGVGA